MENKTYTTQKIVIDGHPLAYITAGAPTNPCILMIHGWFSHKLVWRLTIPALEKNYYCVAVDVLGLGESDKPPEADYSIPAQARRLVAVMDKLGLEQFIVMGHSMGGQIAQEIASHAAPKRVIKLVDVAGVTSGQLHRYPRYFTLPRTRLARKLPILYYPVRFMIHHSPAFARWEFGTWFYDMRQIPHEFWAIDRKFAMQQEAYVSNYLTGRGIVRHDLTSQLPNITAPTLIVFGKRDAVVPISEGYLAAQHIPKTEHVLLDDCGHFPMFEQPESFVETLKGFLSK